MNQISSIGIIPLDGRALESIKIVLHSNYTEKIKVFTFAVAITFVYGVGIWLKIFTSNWQIK